MVYTANWVIIYHLPPIKGTRNSHWPNKSWLIPSICLYMCRYNEICLIKYICLNCKPNHYQKYVYVYISIPMHINPYIYNTTRSFSLPLQTKRNKKGCSPTRAPKNPSTLAVGVLLLNCHNLHRTRQFGVDILLQNSNKIISQIALKHGDLPW